MPANTAGKECLPEIIGYAEPWIAAPGETIAIKVRQYCISVVKKEGQFRTRGLCLAESFAPIVQTLILVKVSCTEPEYSYRLVRLIQGVQVDNGPKQSKEEILEVPGGCRQGRVQFARPGSYGYVNDWIPPTAEQGLQISFYMQPWLVNCPHPQTLLSTLDASACTGLSIVINSQGSIDVHIGTGDKVECLTTGIKPQEKTWTKCKLATRGKDVELSLIPKAFKVEAVPSAAACEIHLNDAAVLGPAGPLFIAANQDPARVGANRTTTHCATNFFNGRIADISLKTHEPSSSLLAKYDFALQISSDEIRDISSRGLHGMLFNAPTRAVRSHDWDGSECDWTKAKSSYGAIHFHDDDMDDAGWDTDLEITIPQSARSGAYAVEVSTINGQDKDAITFFVRQPHSVSDASSKVCLVFSTFTYLAYANERLYDTTRQNTADLGPGFDIDKTIKSEEFYKMQRRTDLGLSTYDRHNDGSGVVSSSSKRPILNIRPGYIMWAFSRPREFSADLMMLGYLEREGIPYEILTDHDLHLRGRSVLQGFNTVITGCHPEYPSPQVFATYNAFAKSGGNLMYMGGNGFYWVSAIDNARPHRLEVRRGDVGVRPYTLPGGEHVNSLDGQQSGTWRSRGMSCNTLFGVGFCAQGTGPGVPFKRTDESRTPEMSWIFDGVSGDLIGEHGLGGGASGDEIDRFDTENGSPNLAKILATSTGHSDDYGIATEDLNYPAIHTLGTQTNLIRSDLVYYRGSGGGSVFSVGSINWYCSLAWNDYDNNVAKVSGNIIKGFLSGKR